MLVLTGDWLCQFLRSCSLHFYYMLHLRLSCFARTALLINVYVSMVLALRSICDGDEFRNIANEIICIMWGKVRQVLSHLHNLLLSTQSLIKNENINQRQGSYKTIEKPTIATESPAPQELLEVLHLLINRSRSAERLGLIRISGRTSGICCLA